MSRSWAVLCMLVFLFAAIKPVIASNASNNAELIKSQLSKNSKLCADFEQHKSLAVLDRPLISNGKIIFLANKGVLWTVLRPFPSKALVTETEIIKWAADGTKTRSKFAQSPLFGAMTQVFFAMFTGNIDSLNEMFELTSSKYEEDWSINLVPTDSKLSTVISSMKISGQQNINSITIEEIRGDVTKILFQKIETENCLLNKAEEAVFAN